jgi:hypothetical protein
MGSMPGSTDSERQEAPSVDVQAVMRGVRLRARERRSENAEIRRLAEQVVSPALALALSRLDAHLEDLRRSAPVVGAPPPTPRTLRGRMGAVMVAVVRRALFWFIPPLESSQAAMLGALEAQYRASTEIAAALRDLNAKLIALRAASASRQEGSERSPE